MTPGGSKANGNNIRTQKLGNQGISIAWQELFAILVAWQVWGELLKNHRIQFRCNNEAVVNMINIKRSKIPRVMDLLRHLTLLTLQHNIFSWAEHIPGKHNKVADALSRFQFPRFQLLAPEAEITACPIPVPVMTL